MSTHHRLTLNGKPAYVVADPMARLLDVLRRDLGLTGAKEGCGEGECGACTVLLDGEPVCACLVPIFQCDGASVITVEGIETNEGLTALQQVFAAEGGTQCGACTPGMIVTLKALLDRNPSPSREQVRESLSGTLCRCTGYERIFRAVEVLTQQRKSEAASEVTT